MAEPSLQRNSARSGLAWVTPEERVALEAHLPEISGVWAAVLCEIGGPVPPLTFDEGIRLAIALAGPIRADGTVAIDMPTLELRSMLARVQEDLARQPGVDGHRVRQIESVCARFLR